MLFSRVTLGAEPDLGDASTCWKSHTIRHFTVFEAGVAYFLLISINNLAE